MEVIAYSLSRWVFDLLGGYAKTTFRQRDFGGTTPAAEGDRPTVAITGASYSCIRCAGGLKESGVPVRKEIGEIGLRRERSGAP